MSITLTQGATSITISQPYFGYSTIIKMGLHYARTSIGYQIWDDTATYDSRLCKIPTWLLSASDQAALRGFIQGLTLGRGQAFTLNLGATASGFFPFGPDYGDIGSFQVELWENRYDGVTINPYLQHQNEVTLAYVSGPTPAYTPAGAENEGTLQIGTVTTLRPLQSEAKPTREPMNIRTISRSGVVEWVDGGPASDVYEADCPLHCRPGNAAALISYLVGTARGADITVVTPANTFLFGEDQGSSGTYTVKNLTNEIAVTHDRYDLFTTQLRFWMKSKDA